VADTLGVPAEVDADGLGTELDVEGVRDDVDAEGVGEAMESLAEGASDALPVATSPFNIVFALACALLAGAAPSLPPQPTKTSAPTRSATPAAALPERRPIAVTSRTAYPQSPALQPDEKPVRRLGS
jgi:hypothetical protein